MKMYLGWKELKWCLPPKYKKFICQHAKKKEVYLEDGKIIVENVPLQNEKTMCHGILRGIK